MLNENGLYKEKDLLPFLVPNILCHFVCLFVLILFLLLLLLLSLFLFLFLFFSFTMEKLYDDVKINNIVKKKL